MKNIILAILFTVTMGCSANRFEIETLTLAPYKADCQSVFAQKCYVQILTTGEKQFFYEDIEGFDFEAGYEYQLKVKTIPRCDVNNLQECPQDIGLYQYILVSQITKTPSTATFEKDFPRNQWGQSD